MPKKDNREYRSMLLAANTAEDGKLLDSNYYVEGYALKYAPYELYADENGPVYEEFDRNAFAGCDMSDVIMQYDHSGRVYARLSNNTLKLNFDDVGLRIAADLSKTELARSLYEDIAAGMINKMSWGFVVDWNESTYNAATRTITHHKIKKIYDVSAVSIPANDNTAINARSFADGAIDEAKRRVEALNNKRAKLRLRLELEALKI